MSDRQLIETRSSEECGCPEEHWLYLGVDLIIHEEADGRVHALLDAGDWDTDVLLPYPSLEIAREPIFRWAHDSIHGLFVNANAAALNVAAKKGSS